MKKLKVFNIFGHPITFQLQDNIIYKSYIGTVATFILFGIGLYVFISLMIDLYARQTPIVIKQENKLDQSKLEDHKYTISDQQLIVIGMSNVLGVLIPPKNEKGQLIYTMKFSVNKAYIDTQEQKFKNDVQLLETTICNEHPDIIKLSKENQIDQSFAKMGYCPIFPKDKVFLKGAESSAENIRFQFGIFKCDPKKYDCAPQEELDQINEGLAIIGLNYQQYTPQKIGNPYITKMNYLKTMFNLKKGQQPSFFFYFDKTESKTIENFFFFDKKDYSHSGIEQNQVFITTNAKEEPNIIFNGAFILSDKEINYQRSYGNILNIFGDVGGFLNILVFAFRVLVIPLEHLSFKINTFLKLYKIENDDVTQEQVKETVNKQKVAPYKDLEKNEEQKDEEQTPMKEDKQVKLRKLLEERFQSKKFKKKKKSLWKIFFDDKLRQIVWKGKDAIVPQLDYYAVIKQKIQFQYLMDLLFNEKQKQLFDFIISQKLMLKNFGTNLLKKQKTTGEQLGVENLVESYESLKETTEEMNQRMINIVNKYLNLSEQDLGFQLEQSRSQRSQRSQSQNCYEKKHEQFVENLNEIAS